jgi:hypothetical protein
MLIPGGDAYTIFDLEGNVVKEVKSQIKIDPRNKTDPAEKLDSFHIQNMFDAITNGTQLNAGIDSGHKSTLLVQLGNISQRVGRSLEIDKENGRIQNDEEAKKLWSRSYEKGWEIRF